MRSSVPFVPPVIDSRGDLWIPSRDGLYRWHQSDLPTAIESSSMPTEPRSFHLEQNYPNPFNQTTHIGFTLKQSSSVSLQVFNTHGQLVATLVEGIRPAGNLSDRLGWARCPRPSRQQWGLYRAAGRRRAAGHPQDAARAMKRDADEMNKKLCNMNKNLCK